eukprot:TRINITY_DN48615_c0_g1_i1.p1 TRINITY_DN48615_c0_g1~~TRINITY_DN48615_c0_g1_i1.p1  ORF type:complete len:153 (-),score=0.61 TRINITY_DN48615_c0_g1_i1:78-497(-)
MAIKQTLISVPPSVFSADWSKQSHIALGTIRSTFSIMSNFCSCTYGLAVIGIGNAVSPTNHIQIMATVASPLALTKMSHDGSVAVCPTRIGIRLSIISTYEFNYSRTLFAINTLSIISKFHSNCFHVAFIFIGSSVCST